jgi:hypothetical protein
MKAFLERVDADDAGTDLLQEELWADHHAIKNALESADSQTNRRLYVRSLITVIDGTTFRLKLQVAILESELEGIDYEYLLERTPKYNSSGVLSFRPKLVRPDTDLAYALSMYTLLHWPSYVIDLTSKGWTSFAHVLDVRNRITHPKSFQDFFVSDEDMTHATHLEEWFISLLDNLYCGCAKQYQMQLEYLRRMIKKKFNAA